ncbi:MAG: hypothetical protein LH480_03960 [Rubrivivax sp.]|nr:hypothetical protein [Rubrivivax sp.]
MIADVPRVGGKTFDRDLLKPVEAAGPDALIRQAVLIERIYSYGETRYYVKGVPLGQQFKTEAAARSEVARRISAGTLGSLPLAAQQKTPQKSSLVSLPGNDGIVQMTGGGENFVVELKARRDLRNGVMQDTGFVAVRVSKYSIESDANSLPRTAYGYPLSSQTKNTLIRTPAGGVITDLAQARQRTRELVASRALTTVSAAEAKELSDASPLAKPVAAMDNLDRVKYLLQETLRRLPPGIAAELEAMLTSPATLVMMGAFCAAQAVPGLGMASLLVGALLLGNDILDTGGKMVGAVQLALSASSHAELVTAGKGMAEALAHGAVSVASSAVGNRAGKAWKNATSGEPTSLRTLTTTVKNYQAGKATPEQVRRAAIVAMQEKRAAAGTANVAKDAPTPPPQTTTQAAAPNSTVPIKRSGTAQAPTRQTAPDPAVAQAAAGQRAIAKTSEGVFADKTLQGQLSQRLIKDARTNPSKNATASIDPQVVQASAVQLFMPKLLQSVFGGRTITKTATDAFTARATAWAKQESPSNPAGALERLAASPALQSTVVRATVIDQLTGSTVASMKVLGASQPVAARALSALRQRLATALDRTSPGTGAQAKLLEPNAGAARTALLREQVGVELGGSTPLASAVQAQLKAKGTVERDLVNVLASPQTRISTMTSALVERWQGSSGQEPLLDGKSQRTLRKAIEGQLAGMPGDVAKEQYLKDLAASGQTRARMARGEPDAGQAVRKAKKQETPAAEAPVPASTARLPGESTENYLARMGVKRSMSDEQRHAAEATGMRMSSKPGNKPAGDSKPDAASGQTFKARSAALQRDLAAAEVSALPQAVLQADSKLLSSLGRDELANLRARLAPRGVALAEGVPQTQASVKALARLDTAALSGPILRTVGFDFGANALLDGNPTLMKAARGYAVRSLAAGQDPSSIVEHLKILFVGKLDKRTGAVIAPPLWNTLDAAQALPRGAAAGSAAQRQAMDYALATYYQFASQGATAPAGGAGAGQWLGTVRTYADTAPAQRPTAPWPEARWSNLQQHLVYDVQLPIYVNRFLGGGRPGGVPQPYTLPGLGPTKKAAQAAAGITPSYERNPRIPAKSERTAFSNPIYDRTFGGAGIERTVIGIDIKKLPGYQDTVAFLRKRNMVLHDWDNGLATAPGGRSVRIQAELERAVAAEPAGGGAHMKAQDRLQDFTRRFTSSDRVVLTRNAYDLMTISTGRGPNNCMTIKPNKVGTWSQTLAGSITEGTLGIYIAKNTDPTLARSSANSVVNRYRSAMGSSDTILGGNYTFFGKSTAMPDGVVQQIADHVDTTFNANGQAAGRYVVHPDVYAERMFEIDWPP